MLDRVPQMAVPANPQFTGVELIPSYVKRGELERVTLKLASILIHLWFLGAKLLRPGNTTITLKQAEPSYAGEGKRCGLRHRSRTGDSNVVESPVARRIV
jgi:hypothetical protein